MVVRISDKTQNYSKVTKLLVKPLIFYIIDFGVFGWGIQRLKEKDEHPIGIILAVTAIEDLIINLLCNIKPITYIIQGVIIILFAVYISCKNRSIKG